MSRFTNDDDFYNGNIYSHYQSILKFLIKASDDEHLAKDIAQETMLEAWIYIKKMKTYDNIEAVLIKSAGNKLKTYFKTNEKSSALIPL